MAIEMPSQWQYTIRVGFADEYDEWVAQIVDDVGTELHTCRGESVSEAIGAAAVAIMDVHDTDSDEGDAR